MAAPYAQGVEQPSGAVEILGKLTEGKFMVDATGVVHAPERQGIGPLACPAFHHLAGEVEVRWWLNGHETPY